MKRKTGIQKEKSGEGFEKLMTVIASAFNPNDKVTHNIKLRENCGNNRQIDVLIEGRNIIIECKDKNTGVTVGEMGTFVDLCKATNSEGIFVSKKGFQKGAIKKANFEGIKTYTLDKVQSEDFKGNFKKPEYNSFIFNLEFKSYTFHIPDELAYLLPLNRDEFIYDISDKAKFTEMTVVNDIYQKVVLKHQLDLFKPLTYKFLFKPEENIIGKIHKEPLVIPIEGQLHFLSNNQFIPIAGITINVEYNLGVKKVESDFFLQRDLKGNVLSETVSAPLTFDNKPYKINFVSNYSGESTYGALVPNFRSSEILPLKNYGEIKNPFK